MTLPCGRARLLPLAGVLAQRTDSIMKIISNEKEIIEKKIVLPLPEVTEEGEVKVPEILGRKKDSHINPLTRHLIAIDGNSGIPQSQVARIHGTSQAAVSALSRGFNTTNIDTRKTNEEILETIGKTKLTIVEKATERLLASIESFEPNNLEDKDLPGAALKLAGVVEKASSGFQEKASETVKFIVVAPRMRSLDSFEVINAEES